MAYSLPEDPSKWTDEERKAIMQAAKIKSIADAVVTCAVVWLVHDVVLAVIDAIWGCP